VWPAPIMRDSGRKRYDLFGGGRVAARPVLADVRAWGDVRDMGQTADGDERDEVELLDRADRLLRAGAAAAALALLEGGRRTCRPAVRPYVDRLIASALLGLGRHDDAVATLRDALVDPAGVGDDRLHALLLAALGTVHHAAGRLRDAAAAVGRAIEHAERVQPPDHALRARLFINQGVVALDAGQVEPATIYYERAVEAARRADDCRRLGLAYMGLGFARQQARDHAAAVAHTAEAMRLLDGTGDVRLAVQARTNLAVAYAGQGAWDVATPHLRRVLEWARAAGDAVTAAHALELLACAASAGGDHADALACAREARTASEGVGDPMEAHLAGVTEARALAALGRLDEAERLYRQAIDYFCAVGASRRLMDASHDYAGALRSRSRDDEARAILDRAYAVTIGLPQG